MAAEARPSTCTRQEVASYRGLLHIPEDVTLRPLNLAERPNRPPTGAVAFSRAIIQSGARLPLNALVRGVLCHYELAPAQLTPNAYKLMASMHVLWHQLAFPRLSCAEFCYIYRPHALSSEPGYYYLSPWYSKTAVMRNLPTSLYGWKDKFFWVEGNFDPESTTHQDGVPRNFRNYGESSNLFSPSLSFPFLIPSLFLTLLWCFSSHRCLPPPGNRRLSEGSTRVRPKLLGEAARRPRPEHRGEPPGVGVV